MDIAKRDELLRKIGLSEDLDAEAEYEQRHDDYLMEMPQSGERIRGRDKMRAFQENYPTPPRIDVRKIREAGDLIVVEAVNDYEGDVFHAVLIVEFRDGKIVRDTRYYAKPFDPPEWRAPWVEVEKG